MSTTTINKPLTKIEKPLTKIEKPLTKQEKRIAIAKDVLKHLRYMRLYSTYGYATELHPCEYKNTQEFVKENYKKCEVCGIASMFLSHIRLYDKVSISDISSLKYDMRDTSYFSVNKETILKHLQKYFTPVQLYLIEAAFERSDTHMSYMTYYANKNAVNAAIVFGYEYTDRKLRLRAIMKNVVKNNGEFIPA